MASDKSLPATPTKVTKLLNKGDIYKSKHINKSLILYIGGTFFVYAFSEICIFLQSYFDWLFINSHSKLAGGEVEPIKLIFYEIFICLFGPAFLSFFIVIVAELALKKFKISLKFPSFDLNKLNPLSNLKKVIGFGENSSKFRLTYNLLKNSIFLSFFLLGFLILFAYQFKSIVLFNNAKLFNPKSLPEFFKICSSFGSLILFFTFCLESLLVLSDLFVEKKWWFARHSMDMQEIRDEQKQDSGDPLLKSQRAQKRSELTYSNLVETVKNSKVIVID